MASFNAHAQDWQAPELHQEVTGATIPGSLEASIDEFIASIPTGHPPALPRKSSRRRLHLNTQGLATHSSSAFPTNNSVDRSRGSADYQVEGLKHSAGQHWRLSSYSSAWSSPIEASSSSEPRTSISSRTTWSDVPPDYDIFRHSTIQIDNKRVSTILSDEDKEYLKAEHPDEEADLERARSLSLYSQDATADLEVAPPTEDSRTLFIDAKGRSSFRLPLLSKESEIQVVDQHGSVAYMSSRSKRSSADISLSKPGLGEIMRISYEKRNLLAFRQGELATAPFTMAGGKLQRRQSFTFPGRGKFEWRYATTPIIGKRKERLVLVQQESAPETSEPIAITPTPDESRRLFSSKRLSRTFSTFSAFSTTKPPAPTEQLPRTSYGAPTNNSSAKASNAAPRILALLSRSDKSSQASSKKRSTRAGMGGELVMEPGCTDALPEEVVVATALVMLRKEQDRLRTAQAAVHITVLI